MSLNRIKGFLQFSNPEVTMDSRKDPKGEKPEGSEPETDPDIELEDLQARRLEYHRATIGCGWLMLTFGICILCLSYSVHLFWRV
jgi:hypothetical protein